MLSAPRSADLDNDARSDPPIGSARAYCHHGEILQGVFDVDGVLCRGLVSLPCRLYRADVQVELAPDRACKVEPAWKTKSKEAARLTLDALSLHGYGANLRIRSTVPVSRGFGSSTTDVVAVIHAVGDAAGCQLSTNDVAHLAVRAEVASDALMYDHPVLFAQREALIIEDFGTQLLDLDVLGFSTPRKEGPVDTLRFPPARYETWEIETFRAIRGILRRGLARRQVTEVGTVASASARLNQRHLPVPRSAELEGLVAEVGAIGLQVAHTGDIAGLLFDSGDDELAPKLAAAEMALRHLGFTDTWRFRTGGLGPTMTANGAQAAGAHRR